MINVVSMAIMSFVLVESDTVVHEELDDEMVHSSLAFFTGLEFYQSVLGFKDRKHSEDDSN